MIVHHLHLRYARIRNSLLLWAIICSIAAGGIVNYLATTSDGTAPAYRAEKTTAVSSTFMPAAGRRAAQNHSSADEQPGDGMPPRQQSEGATGSDSTGAIQPPFSPAADAGKEEEAQSASPFPIQNSLLTLSELAESQLPALAPGMVNVTDRKNGYLVMGTDTARVLAIAFDPTKFELGYGVGDIHTYRFDTASEHWVQLPRDSVDLTKNIVYSSTTKDGDYINAIVRAPDMPETQGYMPTTMSGMEAGDPAAMMQLIQPPVANNQGTVSLTYHIETPHGRQGVEPQLSLSYNSDGGSGWLGEGWNLNGISSITVDTRWGVPGYSKTVETETYLLDGQMLSFMYRDTARLAHRVLNIQRNDISDGNVTRYYMRKEGTFHRIQKFGGSPADYRWVITDKKGNKYYYGGVDKLDLQAVLCNPVNGNIAEWKLSRVEDAQGNYMTIQYRKTSVLVPGSNTEQISSINVEYIFYTFFKNPQDESDQRPSQYAVQFDFTPRKDAENLRFSGRYGFLSGNTDSLTRISVEKGPRNGVRELIRSYRFYFRQGVFNKLLLDSIAQFGLKDAFFNGNKFSYYKGTDGGSGFYGSTERWSAPDDHIKGVGFKLVQPEATSLGSSKSSGKGHSMYFGIGPLGSVTSKDMTVGAQWSSSTGSSSGLVTLVDISGDGRPDKLLSDRNGLRYHPNNGHGFDDKVITIIGTDLRQFSEESSRSSGSGFQGMFGSFSVGRESSSTESTITTYFADANGDGLLDLFSNGAVHFNCGYGGGTTHRFSRLSSATPSPIVSGSATGSFALSFHSDSSENPLHEVVRVWEAPFTDSITLSAPIRLLPPTPSEAATSDYRLRDGVSALIQWGRNYIVDSVSLDSNDYALALTIPRKLFVTKGDRIYFRLQSGRKSDANGSFDHVIWHPEITYRQYNPSRLQHDIYNRNIYRYDAKEDYLLSGANGMLIDSGIATIALEGHLKKAATSDTVHLTIDQYRESDTIINGRKGKAYAFEKHIYKADYLPGQIVNTSVSISAIPIVAYQHLFKCVITSTAGYDQSAVTWEPLISYSTPYREKRIKDDTTIEEYGPVRYWTQKQYPVPQHVFADSLKIAGDYHALPDSVRYTLIPVLEFTDTVQSSETVVFTLRDSSAILVKNAASYKPNTVGVQLTDVPITLNAGQHFFGAYEIAGASLNQRVDKAFFELKGNRQKAALITDYATVWPGTSITVGADGNYSIRPDLRLSGNTKNDSLRFEVVRGDGAVLQSGWIQYRGDAILHPAHVSTVVLKAGDVIRINVKTADSALAFKLTSTDFYLNRQLSAFLWVRRSDAKFGPMYRYWGQFVYNGMMHRAQEFIDEKSLYIRQPAASVNSNVDAVLAGLERRDPTTNPEIREITALAPIQATFSLMGAYADSVSRRWQGGDRDIYLSADTVSSSRLGLDDVTPANPFMTMAVPAGTDASYAHGVKKITSSVTTSSYAGVNPLSGHRAQTRTRILSDYLDLNGDRYPDILYNGQVQLTDPLGGLTGAVKPIPGTHESSSGSSGLGIGGGFMHPLGSVTLPRALATSGKAAAIAGDADNVSANAAVNAGASFSFSEGSEQTASTWLDVNADGLLDKITNDTVHLNLGLDDMGRPLFTGGIRYGTGGITTGRNMAVAPGITLGVNIDNQSIAAGTGMSFANSTVTYTLQDYTGDGLPDRVYVDAAGRIEVEVNTGMGFLPKQFFNDISVSASSLAAGGATLPVTFLPRIGPIRNWIDLDRTKQNGTVGQSLNGAFTFGFEIPLPPIRFVFNPGIYTTSGMGNSYRQIADIDGDGFPDYLYAKDEATILVQRSVLGKANKLQMVVNPLGGSFTIDYIHNEGTTAHPGGKWVMSSVKIDDQEASDREQPAAAFDSWQSFSYEGGRYNRYDREFLGFARVNVQEHDFGGLVYRIRTREFDTANYYVAGNLLKEYVTDSAGRKYTETVQDYQLLLVRPKGDDYLKPALLNKEEVGRVRYSGIVFTALQKTTNYSYEGQSSGIILNQSYYEYNPTGAVRSFKYREGAEVSSTEFDYEAAVTFAPFDKRLYLRDLPVKVRVAKGIQIFREWTAAYNDTGKLVLLRTKHSDTAFGSTTIRYDQFGNVRSVKRPDGVVMEYKYQDEVFPYVAEVKQVGGFSSRTVYDLRFGLPLYTKDRSDNFIHYILDPFGRIVNVIGPKECNNEQMIQCSSAYTLRTSYANIPGLKPCAVVRHYDALHPVETVHFADGFGRSIALKKTADVGGNRAAAWTIGGRNVYDAFGRPVRTYYPDLDSGSDGTVFRSRFNTVIPPTHFEYDVLDRSKGCTLPDGRKEYAVSYRLSGNSSLAAKTIFNIAASGGDQLILSYTNGSGLQDRETRVGNDGLQITTTYRYDPVHQLRTITDDAGNTINYDYDLAGNRTMTDHPDAGRTRFIYDTAGRVVAKITENLAQSKQEIWYLYDGQNHLVAIRYPQHEENNVKYVYGAAGSGYDKGGNDRLVFQEDASGAQAFEYGELGELTKTTRTVVVPFSNVLYTFVTSYNYDTWNRIRCVTYPDGDSVTYGYNRAGLLSSISGVRKDNTGLPQKVSYVTDIDYDEFDQRTYLEYGNGAKTVYVYDSLRRRLRQMDVTALAAGPSSLFAAYRVQYDYDNQNNITSCATTKGLADYSVLHQYSYDNLNRLVKAGGQWSAGKQQATYGLTLSYDSLFNITGRTLALTSQNNGLRKENVTYKDQHHYDPGTHRLADAVGLVIRNSNPNYEENNRDQYRYDSNGNTTLRLTGDKSGRDEVYKRGIVWDEENRITAISMNGYVSHYVYDASGDRTIKMSTEGDGIFVNGRFAGDNATTPVTFNLYANPYYSMRNAGGVYTKHIYIGAQRIISQVENEASFAGPAQIPASNAHVAFCPLISCRDTIGFLAKRVLLNSRINHDFDSLQVPHRPIGDLALSSLPAVSSGKPDNPFETASPAQEPLPAITGKATVFNYFYHSNHLSSVSFVSDDKRNVVQSIDYLPYGETFMEQRSGYSSQFLFNGKEQDAETGLYYYGARYYDPHSYRWLSTDPLAEKYAGPSPYNFCLGNPLTLMDPDGKEPVRSQAGTVDEFTKFLNNTNSKMGTLRGALAVDAMYRLSQTTMTLRGPQPATTGPFNLMKSRYIYTEKGGWIDMSHFMFYAGTAYQYRIRGEKNPIGETVQLGAWQEFFDIFGAPHSAYSYEDLPSDKFAAIFGASVFDPKSTLDFGEQLSAYLNSLGATKPTAAPNFELLPATNSKAAPTRTNFSTTPLLHSPNGSREQLLPLD